MNTLQANISNIETVESLNIVSFNVSGTPLKMMSLELSNDVKVGRDVLLSIKPTHIVLAKKSSTISYHDSLSLSNFLEAKIDSFEVGTLLSSVTLEYNNEKLEAIITTESFNKLDLKHHDNNDETIIMMFQASELSIYKLLENS
jgi:molybdopterin-binding protein